MRRTIWLMLLSLFIVGIFSGCSDQAYVIEELNGNQLSLGPDDQNPEEQYALTEVTLDSETKIDGRTNQLSVLQKGDIIRFAYRNSKKPLVATIEQVK